MNMVIGIVAGIAATIVTILVVETGAHALFPTAEITGGDMARAVALMPLEAKVLVVLGWFAGPLVGTVVAARLTAWRFAPWIIAGLAMISGLATVVMIPHPLWMSVAAVVLPIAALFSGVRLGSRTRTAP